MIRKILKTKKLFSLSEKEHRIIGSNATIPFAPSLAVIETDGVVKRNNNSSIGIYLDSSKNGFYNQFWEIHDYPINAVQVYRTLKLLAKCPIIADDTICACYYVMRKDMDSTSEHYLQTLKESGFLNVEECRSDILAEKISEPYFVDAFLSPLMSIDIAINDVEFHEEVAQGNFSTNIAHFTCSCNKQAVV